MDIVTAIIKIVYMFFLVLAWIEFSCLTYGFGKKSFDRWFDSNKFMEILLSISAWPVLWIGFLFYYLPTVIVAFWIPKNI